MKIRQINKNMKISIILKYFLFLDINKYKILKIVNIIKNIIKIQKISEKKSMGINNYKF